LESRVFLFFVLHWLSSLSFDAFLVCAVLYVLDRVDGRSHSVPIVLAPLQARLQQDVPGIRAAIQFPETNFSSCAQSSNGCSSQDAPAKVSSLPLEAPFGSRYSIILAPNRLHFSKMNVSRVAGSGCALGTSNRSAVSRKMPSAECPKDRCFVVLPGRTCQPIPTHPVADPVLVLAHSLTSAFACRLSAENMAFAASNALRRILSQTHQQQHTHFALSSTWLSSTTTASGPGAAAATAAATAVTAALWMLDRSEASSHALGQDASSLYVSRRRPLRSVTECEQGAVSSGDFVKTLPPASLRKRVRSKALQESKSSQPIDRLTISISHLCSLLADDVNRTVLDGERKPCQSVHHQLLHVAVRRRRRQRQQRLEGATDGRVHGQAVEGAQHHGAPSPVLPHCVGAAAGVL
jgi:hypothetical protein